MWLSKFVIAFFIKKAYLAYFTLMGLEKHYGPSFIGLAYV